jgi:hypothetical protein
LKPSTVSSLRVLAALAFAPSVPVAEGAKRSAETARAAIAGMPAGALVEVKLPRGRGLSAAWAVKNWKPSWKWWIVIGAAVAVLFVLAIAASGGGY